MLCQLSSALQACVITVINCVDNNNDEGTTPGLGTALALLGACAWRQIRIPRNGLYPFSQKETSPLFCPERGLRSQSQEREEPWVQAPTCASCTVQPQSAICPLWAQKPPSVKVGPSSSAIGSSDYPTCHCMALWARKPTSGPGGDRLLLLRVSLRQRWPLRQPLRRFWPNLCC